MSAILLAPVLLPAFAAAVYALLGWRPATSWVAAASATGGLACAIIICLGVVRTGSHTTLAGLVRVDALSAFMLLVIAVIAVVATVATPGYLRGEMHAGRATARTATRHSLLVQFFLATMALAVLAANLGLLWVAVEATTIVTAFLVGQRRTRPAVEAAWKYVVICSTGIALALLGTLVLGDAAQHAPGAPGLDLARLTASAAQLNPAVTRIAVVLLILGFGTKAGLAPLHAWLPDAHSQAPAPVSALMSGVLLSVAFYAILRVKIIADAAVGAGFTRALLVIISLVSLALAASLLLAQRDYKRMLAYSSIEHMGLLALGAAAGTPLAITAVLLHILGHGLVKSVLFLGSGRILQITGSSRIDAVRGLAARQPLLAGCVGLGVLALIGFPPFSLFASEWGIARAGFAAGLGWATTGALLLLLVISAALITHTSRMLLGPARDAPGAATHPRPVPLLTAGALIAGLLACAALGLSAAPLHPLLAQAVVLAGGSP